MMFALLERSAVAIALSVLLAMGSLAADDAAETPIDESLEARVYDGLAKLGSIRRSTLPRHAFVATGEITVADLASHLTIMPFYVLRVDDKARSHHYQAFGEVQLAGMSGNAVDLQSWAELMIRGGTTQCSLGYINRNRRYQSQRVGETSREFFRRLGFKPRYLDPLDDIVLVGNNIESPWPNEAEADEIFIRNGKLQSVEVDGFGNLVSRWNYKTPIHDFRITLTQAKNFGYLPINVDYREADESDPFFSMTRCEWKEVDGKLLPYRIESACSRGTNKNEHYTRQWVMKLDWLVGERIPKEFFEHDIKDYREPFRKHFDLNIDHLDENGQVLRSSWESPAELFDEWNVK